MQIAVDFSLALHNRTGKYFVGRDIVADHAADIGSVSYWRITSDQTPVGLKARLIGKAMSIESDMRVAGNPLASVLPLRRPRRPVLHLDPHSVAFHRIVPGDIVLCHDMGPITHPHLFRPAVAKLYQHVYARIAEARPRMVFVSRASQTAFHARYDAGFPHSRVIYNPLRAEAVSGGSEPVPGVAAPYLLTVGNVGQRKNQKRCIEAFAASGLAARGVSYVICGGKEPGWEAADELAARTPGVLRLGYVTDGQLRKLYREASGLVLVSELEGFGVPVAEAASYGVAPLVSAGSVLQEVAGDSAVLAEPEDVASIARGMQRLVALTDADRAAAAVSMNDNIARFSLAGFSDAWSEEIRAAIAAWPA